MKDFNYQITEQVAVLSRSNDGMKTLEINRISYNGREPKIDIRRWDRSGGNEKMLKGLTLTDEEAARLGEALLTMGDDTHDLNKN